jgi:hypothetical protein
MKWLLAFLSCILVSGLLMGAGCTQPVSNTGPTSPAGIPASPLGALALTAADAPANYTLVESRAKTIDEVGPMARDLGWEGGYLVKYSGLPDNRMGPTEITQTITTYPAAGMHDMVALVEANDKSDNELIITALPSPGLGNSSLAFSGKAISQIVMREKTDNPLDSGSLKGSLKQDIVEIIIARDSTLEVLRMTGPGADYATLETLAKKAYQRFP